jgi:hypothetical protein
VEIWLGCKFLKGHDLKGPVFGVLDGLVTDTAISLLPSDIGIQALGVKPNVCPWSARTKEFPIQSAAPKPDSLVAIQTLDSDALRGLFLSESVKDHPVLFSDKVDERLDVLAGVSASPAVGNNTRNQGAS